MPRLLGLDIDKNHLGISAADIRLRRVTPLKSDVLAIPQDSEERSRAISEVLQKWKSEMAPTGVVVGMPLQNFSCRLLEMPVMGRDDLKRALPFELEKHLPLPVDEYLHDFLMIKGQSEIRTCVLSIRKDTVAGTIKLISEAGLEVVSVRCRVADVISRLLESTHEKDFSGLFVQTVDDGYELAGLAHSVPLALKRLSAGSDLADELERFSERFPGRVYFSGGIDQLAAEHFRGQKFQIPVADALVASYAKKGRAGLDFMPQDLITPAKDIYPYLIGGLAALAVFFYILTGLVSYYKDAHTLNMIESRIEEIKSRASGVIESRKQLDSLQEERKAVLDFRANSNRAVRALKDLSAAVPVDSWIMSLAVDEKNVIEIEGFSKKTSELVRALEKTNNYRNISFSSPIISKDGEERFSLKLEGKE